MIPKPSASLAILLLLGCTGGADRPQVSTRQIEEDAEAALPTGSAFEKGPLVILETDYSGSDATVVVEVGSVAVGKLVPAPLDGVDAPVQRASVDRVPWKLRLGYEWTGDAWRLRRVDTLTLDSTASNTPDAPETNGEPR